jgi:cobalamin biosynthesis protein CbiD
MARTNPLDDPEFALAVAEALAAGLERQEMDRDTISRWKKHPTVKRMVMEILRDRVTEVNRVVDGQIRARLQEAENMTVRELLDIRKEFKGADLVQGEKADENTVNEAHALPPEDIDEAIANLEKLLAGRK